MQYNPFLTAERIAKAYKGVKKFASPELTALVEYELKLRGTTLADALNQVSERNNEMKVKFELTLEEANWLSQELEENHSVLSMDFSVDPDNEIAAKELDDMSLRLKLMKRCTEAIKEAQA